MKFSFESKTFIEQTVESGKLAVIGDDVELSWLAFEERVNLLCEKFTVDNMTELKYPVIIYGHKSANMIVAMYAMIKLGIPYIPLDKIYPEDRIVRIAEIAKSQILINTTSSLLGFNNITEILLDKENYQCINKKDSYEKTAKSVDPLIYIIFTSGSTGEPKGVQISTEAVRSFARWMTADFGFNSSDVFINTAILSFDLSVFEVITFAAIGGTILLNNKETESDPALLASRIQQYQGTVWVSTPSFALIYSRMGTIKEMESVNCFLFCGEVLPHGIAKSLKNNFKTARIYNTYGPTEATVATTLVEIDEAMLSAHDPLPVGKSKRESSLLIENGEIIIVGDNVSVGYLNRPDLNQVKFLTINGKRAFKTGDNGYLENDMLFFNGRNDDLIKLHGYRIELNEINTAINNLDYVLHGEAIALKRDGIAKKIVALIQPDTRKDITINNDLLKKDLALKLPHYMIPSDFKIVSTIPLNANGKADKKLLTELYLQK